MNPAILNSPSQTSTQLEATTLRVERAIYDIRRGRPVVLLDDLDRENEGDLIVAAECVTVPVMAMLIRECSGIVCLCLDEGIADNLLLSPMVEKNESRYQTAFTISIEARHGVTTGVSAQDRVKTVLTAVAADAQPKDLVHPGHIFPLRAARGGVLERRGHTEGAVDLARLAGLRPAALLCELTNVDGSMSKGEQIVDFAASHRLTILSVDDLVAYRAQKEERE